LRPEEFFSGAGSIVEVMTASESTRFMAGCEKAPVFVDGSPVFEPQEEFKGTVLSRIRRVDRPLLPAT